MGKDVVIFYGIDLLKALRIRGVRGIVISLFN
jgi:hypothetical protein